MLTKSCQPTRWRAPEVNVNGAVFGADRWELITLEKGIKAAGRQVKNEVKDWQTDKR